MIGLPARGDLAERLVPGDALPLAAALGPDAAQRVQQPVGVIDVIEIRPHLGAEPAARDGMVRIAAEADGPAVAHLGEDAAGVGAVVRAGATDL